jgi:hypothetical protein
MIGLPCIKDSTICLSIDCTKDIEKHQKAEKNTAHFAKLASVAGLYQSPPHYFSLSWPILI